MSEGIFLEPTRCFWGCAEWGFEVGILKLLQNPPASRICVAALLAVGGCLPSDSLLVVGKVR